jgi:hypothetical protein
MSDNVVEFSVRGIDDFSAVFDKLSGSLEMLKTGFMAVVAAYPVVKLEELAKASLDNAEAMYFAAQKAEVTITEFSSLSAAASLAGVSSESMGAAFKFLGKALADSSGSQITPAAKQLEALGISTKDPAKAMLELADIFANTADDANKTKVAVELFGRAGVSMVPMLNEGSEKIKEMQQAAIDLGQQIGPEFGASAKQINDNLTEIGWTISGAVNKAMAELSPTIEGITGATVKWIKENDIINISAGVLYAALKTLVVVCILVVDAIGLIANAIKNVSITLYEFEEGLGGVFNAVVTSLGTIGAALVEVAQGHFANAKQIMMDGADQTSAAWEGAKTHLNAAAVSMGTTVGEAVQQIITDTKEMGDVIDGTAESAAAAEAKAAKAKRDAADSMQIANQNLITSYDELLKKVTEAASAAQGQVMAFGLSADQVKQYDLANQLAILSTKGLDTAQIAAIQTQLTTLKHYADLHDAQEQNKKDQDELTKLNKADATQYESFALKMQELIDLNDRLGGSSEVVAKAMQNESDKFKLAQTTMLEYKNTTSATQGVMKTFSDLMNRSQKELGSVSFQIAQGIMSTWKTMSKGVGDAVAAVLVDGASFAKAFDAILATAAKNIISTLVELGIQQVVFAALGVTTNDTAATANIGGEAGIAAAAAFADSCMMGPEGLVAAPAVGKAAGIAAEVLGMSFMATAGAAHGGLDYVPAESTYLLQKGERVLSPNQNQDLTSALKGGSSGGLGGGLTIHNLTFHIMEKATNTGAFATMNKIDLRNKLGQPVIDVLNEMYKMGRRPNFAMQKK